MGFTYLYPYFLVERVLATLRCGVASTLLVAFGNGWRCFAMPRRPRGRRSPMPRHRGGYQTSGIRSYGRMHRHRGCPSRYHRRGVHQTQTRWGRPHGQNARADHGWGNNRSRFCAYRPWKLRCACAYRARTLPSGPIGGARSKSGASPSLAKRMGRSGCAITSKSSGLSQAAHQAST